MDAKTRGCQSKGRSKQRDAKTKGCQSKGMSKQRDVKAKGCQSKGMSKQIGWFFITWTFRLWRMSRTKASFSHLPLSDFEGRLARKLGPHIFNLHFLRDVSHESFVFHIFSFHFLRDVSHEMRFWEIADARNAAFCRTKRVPEDGWGSLSSGRLRNTFVAGSWSDRSGEELRRAAKIWEKLRWKEMRKAQMTWEEKRTVVISWEELRTGEKTWDGMRWDAVEKRWEDMRWVKMRWETQSAVTVGCSEQFPREAAMRWNQTKWEKIQHSKNMASDWKSRACCCEAQESCLSPIGTAFAPLYRL